VQAGLTEWKFRGYWEQTADLGNYPKPRFAAVQQALIVNHAHQNQPKAVGHAIASLADGQWHYFKTITAHAQKVCAERDPPIPVTDDDVLAVLAGMVKRGTHGVIAERRKGAKGEQYRLSPAGRSIDYHPFMLEAGPILDGLDAEGDKNMATMSPGTVAHLAATLRKVIEKWARAGRPSP
jgi:hypothetical protein